MAISRGLWTDLLIVAAGVAVVWLGWSGFLSGPHPMTGKPAPSFTATVLNGDTVDLTNIIGKQVVLLDFWAVWCPPCRESLPGVGELWKEYGEKGVAVYAVNLGDEPANIQAFLQDLGVEVPVLLDPAGDIATQYGVSGIPHLVIIGPDGVVDSVQVGAGPGLKDALRTRLDALLEAGSADLQNGGAAGSDL